MKKDLSRMLQQAFLGLIFFSESWLSYVILTLIVVAAVALRTILDLYYFWW